MNEDLKWLAENVHEWPEFVSYAVVVHCENGPKVVWDRGSTFGETFSRAQWKAARDELGPNHSVDSTEKVWRGIEDGLPPVGGKVEAWFDDGRVCWHEAYVIGRHPREENTVAVSLIGDHESRLIWVDKFGVRPIRTEEDKVVEEMMESGAIGAFFGAGGGAINDAAFQALFKHMVRHGYRKQETKQC